MTTAARLVVSLLGAAPAPPIDVAAERTRVVAAADRFLGEAPVTVTATRSPRSAGGAHDFFSEGDYWWPDPATPGGPYVQRDGMTNPDNFTAHRQAMMRLSVQVPALVQAWRLTRDRRYAAHAARHLRAWFVETSTRMNPSLLYAQAIHGRATGRGIGIIDTIHLVEVARAIEMLDGAPGWSGDDQRHVRGWFRDYLAWLTSHPHGLAERDARNNHGTCWVMQVAAFARLTDQQTLLAEARERFRTILLPGQMAVDGSRTKPVDLLTARWTRHGQGHGLHGAVHPRPPRLAQAARRDVRPGLADASCQPAVCRRRLAPADRPRACRPTRTSRRWCATSSSVNRCSGSTDPRE